MDDDTTPSWGAKVNTGGDHWYRALTTGRHRHRGNLNTWRILWDHAAQRDDLSCPINALDLLDDLRTRDDWRQGTITVDGSYSRIPLPAAGRTAATSINAEGSLRPKCRRSCTCLPHFTNPCYAHWLNRYYGVRSGLLG